MTRRIVLGCLVMGLVLAGTWTREAGAQEEELLPTIIGGPGGIEAGVTSLGRSPGAGGLIFEGVPGTGEPLLGGRPGPAFPRVPSAVTRPGGGFRIAPSRGLALPPPLPFLESPAYGPLDLPADAEPEGPPDGLTLDQAIERLIQANLDLSARFHEIPKAQADILTAGLRANPLLFFDAQRIPYGGAGRTAGPSAASNITSEYDLNVNHPLDLNHKRRARQEVARRAERVLEAQFQDAVRVEMDNLGAAYVAVLGQRETVRFARASVEGLQEIAATTRVQLEQQAIAEADFLQVRGQLHAARIGLRDAEESFLDAKRNLGLLLNLPMPQAEMLQLRGTIRDQAPPAPPIAVLTAIALQCRPDLTAFRLGVARAEADVRLARANRFQDVYLLYQPYTWEGGVTSWAMGATVPLPVYNRNQGLIRRARINVSQVQTELAAQEQRVLAEVRKAEREYRLTRRAVEDVERDLLPDARLVRDSARKRFTLGEIDAIAWLNAQRAYNDIVRQYRDTLVRHRLSMLRLNTAIGHRVLP